MVGKDVALLDEKEFCSFYCRAYPFTERVQSSREALPSPPAAFHSPPIDLKSCSVKGISMGTCLRRTTLCLLLHNVFGILHAMARASRACNVHNMRYERAPWSGYARKGACFSHRLVRRHGKKKAIRALAHNVLVIIDPILGTKKPSNDPGTDDGDQRDRGRSERHHMLSP